MSERILSFDLSFTCTGWSVIEKSKILAMGNFPLGGSCKGEKLNCLYKKAAQLIMDWEPEILACEDVFPSKYTMGSYKPLVKLQSILEMLAFRLNRSEPQLFLASEVRPTFDLNPQKMKKDFVAYSKKMGYSNTDSKNKSKKRYDDFKKNQIVAKVNSIFKKDYPNGLLTNDQHDIADSILLGLHVESLIF